MINYLELKKLGLSDKEAKIYLTSLQRGPETAQSLAKLAGIVRPTAYVIFDSLIKKGLMSTQTKGKKTYYVSEPPDHLLSLIRLQKQELEETEREFKNLIPALQQLSNIQGEKPRVRLFEGKEGLQSVRELLLKTKTKSLCGFVPVDLVFGLFSEKEHTEIVTKKRIERKIHSRVIYTSKKGPIFKAKDSEKLREAKFIDEKNFPFSAGIDIYDNLIALFTFKDKYIGVVIENEDVANTMRTIFNMIWAKY